MVVVWCLFYGRVPAVALFPLCAGFGTILALPGRHRTRFPTTDRAALASRLSRVNPSLKLWTALVLTVLCIEARSYFVGVFLAAAALVIVVFAGGLRLRDYVYFMALPVSFLMISALALLFEITAQYAGGFGFPLFGFWLCVTPEAQIRATHVIARALGAVSCLYMLSLTTPMSVLIGAIRLTRCPEVFIELMYLTYRYMFTLITMYHTMRDAAKSRLGYVDYRTSLRTTGNLYTNLLGRSYRYANMNFDAMESRCFDTGIRFLENREKVTGLQTAAAVGFVLFTLTLSLLLR